MSDSHDNRENQEPTPPPEAQAPTPEETPETSSPLAGGPVLRAPAPSETGQRPSAVIEAPDPSRPTPAGPPQGRGRGRGGPGQGRGGPGRGGPGRGGPGRGRGGPGQGRGGRGGPQEQAEESEFIEKVVHINRCAKVVKGGRRFSFSALVVMGDGKGKVGVGYGKAKEVPEAIRKGTEQAQKRMVPVSLRNNTIPHQVTGIHDGGKVLLRPATPGTGVIAGGGVRAVLEACGVRDVLSKSLGSNNHIAVVTATLKALQQLRSADDFKQLRAAE